MALPALAMSEPFSTHFLIIAKAAFAAAISASIERLH
jgi:hypothetical protein